MYYILRTIAEMSIFGPSLDDSSGEGTDDPEPVQYWFAVVRGLQVGVHYTW